MSLQKKIILSFLISAGLIAALAAYSYVNFYEIRKEIRYLELSDSLRSKTLQLRRHEKNFFLYRDIREMASVYDYIAQIRAILEQNKNFNDTGEFSKIRDRIDEYHKRFGRIEFYAWKFLDEIKALKTQKPAYSAFFPVMESTFLEGPLVNADLIGKLFGLRQNASLITILRELDSEIASLRKNGEEILMLSKDLDRSAREKADRTIRISQTAVAILFPLFLIVGLTALFAITRSTVNHLKLLARAIEKTGKGDFTALPATSKHDEIGFLIDAFNKMENDLIARDKEIEKKNDELLQTRKLASIGTLASGVAHELNNPLNNIYLAAQILTREIKDQAFPNIIRETVNDIFSQTLRVKRIVSDLLEFSREKPPFLQRIRIAEVIHGVLHQISAAGDLADVEYSVDAPEDFEVNADRHLMEQVFVNLFTNAVDAMGKSGVLKIRVAHHEGVAVIEVSDTGPGIPEKDLPRIFDPFFTTKEKGTGLGLAIVYNIIKKHHGRVEVKSEPAKGTTFTLWIPEE
jgi:signal transduction histidine kinase